jgi:hypothetical protein
MLLAKPSSQEKLAIKDETATEEGKLPDLPPEIIDDILIWTDDVQLVNGLGRFSIMKKFMPVSF